MQRGTEREREESATVSDQSAELPSGRTLPQRHNSTHAAGQAASGEGRGSEGSGCGGRGVLGTIWPCLIIHARSY